MLERSERSATDDIRGGLEILKSRTCTGPGPEVGTELRVAFEV